MVFPSKRINQNIRCSTICHCEHNSFGIARFSGNIDFFSYFKKRYGNFLTSENITDNHKMANFD